MFWVSRNHIQWVLSTKIFTNATVRPEVVTPPPYGQPDRKISGVFLTTSLRNTANLWKRNLQCCSSVITQSVISRDPTLLLQVPDATNKKFASLPCDFPHFRHLGNSCGSHSPTLCETNSEIWNLNTSSTKGIARKTVQSFQCISGRFGNDRGMVHLDLAGVHHDPHPLSHGLRIITC